MATLTSLEQLVSVFEETFGSQGVVVATDPAARAAISVVMDRYEVGFALDPDHGSFGIAVRIGPRVSQTVFFGKPPLLDPEEAAVREMFVRVLDWCTSQSARA